MKTLVVYFSLEGNTKFIAEIIAEQLQADSLELKTKNPFQSEGFKKYILAGKSAIFKDRPELVGAAVDLSVYDTIAIGTPVWAGSYTPPISTFLNQHEIEGKKVALFICHARTGADKCIKKLKDDLAGNTFIGVIDFVDPLKTGKEENQKKAAQWAASLATK